MEFRARLLGTIPLCALGLWFAITRQTGFLLGGDPSSSLKSNGVMHVNATGLDAVAIGCFFIALGIINLALGVRGPRRIPVFWTGAGLMLATFAYGIVQAVLAVAGLF